MPHTCQDEDEENKTESGSEDNEDAPEAKQIKKEEGEKQVNDQKKNQDSTHMSTCFLYICPHAWIACVHMF